MATLYNRTTYQGFIQGGGGPGISPPPPPPPRKFRKLCNYIVTCDNTIVIIAILSVWFHDPWPSINNAVVLYMTVLTTSSSSTSDCNFKADLSVSMCVLYIAITCIHVYVWTSSHACPHMYCRYFFPPPAKNPVWNPAYHSHPREQWVGRAVWPGRWWAMASRSESTRKRTPGHCNVWQGEETCICETVERLSLELAEMM